MGNLGTATIAGPAASGLVRYFGAAGQTRVIITATMSASYATGGDTLVLPGDIRAKELRAVNVITRQDGTRTYDWNGSRSTPKIKAYTAPGTEVAAATNLSAVTLTLELIYSG